MSEQARHVALLPVPWDADEVRTAIEEIVSDALSHFDPERFWPAHPLDEGIRDGHTSFYFGATGVIWALEYLRRTGATERSLDFRANLPRLISANAAEFTSATYGEYAAHGSFLFGDMGTALLVMHLAPTAAVADIIHERANANMSLPVRELMWGMPGSMLACLHMFEMTGERCWQETFATQATRLLGELEETANGPLWTQDLYGKRQQFLGPVHGFAGNMIPLLRGWQWLTEAQRVRVAEAVPRTLTANAWGSELGVSWHGTVANDRPPWLCQHCHGAAGMVTTFAEAPFLSPELEKLLLEGGRFTWAAGPLAKGCNLCHGTGGNGYAFLKLYRRTKDVVWLQRSRAFAMTGIAQCRKARAEFGRGRYSLWTGDVGFAVYLWDCLAAEPHFPTVDVF
jgi:Lanthionine synthetase C-like protein